MHAFQATFLTDIPTLGAIAFIIILLCYPVRRIGLRSEDEERAVMRRMDIALAVVTAAFILGVETATFFNVPYAMWAVRHLIGEKTMSGTDFMWNGYFHWPLPGLCRAVTSQAEAARSFCAALEPSKDPMDWHWWPVVALCFAVQAFGVYLVRRSFVGKSRAPT